MKIEFMLQNKVIHRSNVETFKGFGRALLIAKRKAEKSLGRKVNPGEVAAVDQDSEQVSAYDFPGAF